MYILEDDFFVLSLLFVCVDVPVTGTLPGDLHKKLGIQRNPFGSQNAPFLYEYGRDDFNLVNGWLCEIRTLQQLVFEWY